MTFSRQDAISLCSEDAGTSGTMIVDVNIRIGTLLTMIGAVNWERLN